MSYKIIHQYGGLRFPEDKEQDILARLVTRLTRVESVMAGTRLIHRPTPYFQSEPDLTLERALNDLGFAQEDCESGYRVSEDDLTWTDEMESALRLITHYAKDGQMLAFQGEDGTYWGYLSRRGECVEIEATLTWHAVGDTSDVIATFDE